MLVHIVNANRFERSVTDVQRVFCERRNLRNFLEHLRREMQARRRRRNRATLFRVNRLVSFGVFSRNTGRTLDIWWQRRRSDLCEHVVKWTFTMKTHATQLRSWFVEHLCDQTTITEDGTRVFFQTAAGTHERLPNLRLDLAYEEDLNLPA